MLRYCTRGLFEKAPTRSCSPDVIAATAQFERSLLPESKRCIASPQTVPKFGKRFLERTRNCSGIADCFFCEDRGFLRKARHVKVMVALLQWSYHAPIKSVWHAHRSEGKLILQMHGGLHSPRSGMLA
jgi:hypothetical protein